MPETGLDLEVGAAGPRTAGFLRAGDADPRGGVPAIDPAGRWPLGDDTVGRLIVTDAFAGVADPSVLIGEIHRVCRHGAAVCLAAPFGGFNEQTPRFWSHDQTVPDGTEDLLDPHDHGWGLRPADAKPRLDLRTVSMECLTTPAFITVPERARRDARRAGERACDTIVYHLRVWKPGSDAASVDVPASGLRPIEPAWLAARRTRDAALAGELWRDIAAAWLGRLLGPASERRSDESCVLESGLSQLLEGVRGDGRSRRALVWSDDLAGVPYLEYAVGSPGPLAGVALAILAGPGTTGRIGVEVVDDRDQIRAQVMRPLDDPSLNVPARFRLGGLLADLGDRFRLRVFARDATGPVRVLEVEGPRRLGRRQARSLVAGFDRGTGV
jgi:hypothetical protein